MRLWLRIVLRSLLLWFLICLIGSVVTIFSIDSGFYWVSSVITIFSFALPASLLFSGPLFIIYNLLNFFIASKFKHSSFKRFKHSSIIFFTMISMGSSFIIIWTVGLPEILIFFNILAILILLIEKKYFKLFEGYRIEKN